MPESPLTQRDVEALRTTLDKLDRTIEYFRDFVESTYVRKDVIDPKLADMRKDIDAHSDWLTWVQRIVIGALLLAAVGAVIYSGTKGGG
jgi:hypothetical protein